MKTKNLVQVAIILAIGAVLHFIVPGFINGMKPDFLLISMFISILLNRNIKSTVIITASCGLISALTTSFPGGQIPSVLDKVVSGFSFFILILIMKDFKYKKNISIFICTIISGYIFLESAIILTGINLPGGLLFMILTIVIPTAVVNSIFSILVLNIISKYENSIK